MRRTRRLGLRALSLPFVLVLSAAGESSSAAPPDAAGAPMAAARQDPAAPARVAALSPRARAFANLDPTDDLVVGPPGAVPDCEAELTKAGVTFRAAALPVHRQSKLVCGAPQVVTYLRGPGNVSYQPAPVLTCGMALTMASFEQVLQEEAKRIFKSPVVGIEQLGTYSCRGIAAFRGVVSEHSYANAIDLSRFTLANGKTISVLHDFEKSEGVPARPAGVFLRAVSERLYDEDVFSNVLTPFWNAAHKNHFHLDLARYRVNGVRAGR